MNTTSATNSKRSAALIPALLLALAGLCPVANTHAAPAPLTGDKAVEHLKAAGQYDSLAAAVTGARYAVNTVQDASAASPSTLLRAQNPAHGLSSTFTPEGLTFTIRTGAGADATAHTVGWRLRSLGYGAAQTPVPAGTLRATGQRVELTRTAPAVTEWFVNEPAGLEHGFTLPERPAANPRGEPLCLVLVVTGDLTPQADAAGQTLDLRDAAGRSLLTYAKLKVWDATGTELPAAMLVADGQVTLTVPDRTAQYPLTIDPIFAQQAYLKASNPDSSDQFGNSVAVSGDTVVVGAYGEDSSTSGVNTTPNNNLSQSGAAYVFVRNETNWVQQAYLKASNPDANDLFGYSVAVSGDTVVVGAYGEASNATGVNGNQYDNSAPNSGAAYVFVRNGTNWNQQAYLKSGTNLGFGFGTSVAVEGDTAVIGNAIAAYVFARTGTNWSQQAYLYGSITEGVFQYGGPVAVSGDTVVLGAPSESSNATGVNGNQNDNSAYRSGAAYIFVRNGTNWTKQAYLKATNTAQFDYFGYSVAISGDTVVVGRQEDISNSAHTGAAHVFVRSGTNWSQQAYLTASPNARFGYSVAVSGDTVVVGARYESVNFSYSGATYVFARSGTNWSQQARIVASNPAAYAYFGNSVAVSGDRVLVGAEGESSNVNASGAAYIFLGPPLQLPTVSLLPPSLLLPSGSNVTFSASAQGTSTLYFQWLRNGLPITNNSFISGATTLSLTLSNIQPQHTGAYSLRVTNMAGSVVSSSLVLTVAATDSDGDGLPDSWEVAFGLNPNNRADAILHPVIGGQTNPLSYLQFYLLGFDPSLDPRTLDSDHDGLTDYDEIFLYGTDPKNPDTDGDGIPDGVEVQYGLNPRVNDANESKSFDGVTNLQKYQWNLAHTSTWEQMYPNRAFSGTNTVSDYERYNPGMRYSRPVYDRNDRLIGVEYSSGVSLAYVYDGNGNLVRQKWISRASETNGLPALFTFLNNLTNGIGTGPYDDPDGDGWTNFQEWKAGTNPKSAISRPDNLPTLETNILSLTLPFTPSNFVMAAGQLDGVVGDELVIGADGNPGGTTNAVFILTQNGFGWQTQRVDVGAFGITSIAIGQPTNRPAPAIYLGLRQASGSGRIVELSKVNGVWLMPTNAVAMSTNEAAFVLGVRGTDDLLASFATNGMAGALFGMTYSNNAWTQTILSTNTSNRGLGTHGIVWSRILRDASFRLLDGGGIEAIGGRMEFTNGIPVDPLWNPIAGKWNFMTPSPMDWSSAHDYFRTFGGSLVTINSASENQWILTSFPVKKWIGLYRQSGTLIWDSGSPVAFTYTCSSIGNDFKLFQESNDVCWWATTTPSSSIVAVGEVSGASQIFSNKWSIPEPLATSRLVWRGLTLVSGSPRLNQTNSGSVFHAFVDDRNQSTSMNAGDEFVVVEYAISGNTVTTDTLIRVPITAATVAQSYGLASVNFLPNQPEVLFTAEPDGQIYSWQATNATGQLQRQLFSATHQSKAWHALAGVKMSEATEGLVGLRVDPANPSACSVIFWPPQQTMSPLAISAQSAPGTLILPSPNSGSSLSQVSIRLLDNEGNASLPMLEFQTPGSTTWSNATIVSVDGQTVGRVAALPTGSDHTIVWNAGRDLGPGFTNIVQLRARASDVTLTGDYSATVSYRVELSAGNPVANPDSTNTLQDVPVDINVLANDTVQNGRTLSIVAYTQPVNGVASLNANQTLRYTPRTSFLGTDSFNYTISDGTGGTNIAVVTVAVLPVNHPPTPQSYAFTTAEDTPVTFAWNNDRDVDGDLVTLFSVRSPSGAGGTVTMQSGVITYTPATNFFGTDTFTFIVQDNGLTGGLPDPKQATNTVTITVTPVNDTPVITLVTNRLVVNEDTPLLFTGVSVSDPDAANGLMLANLSVTNGVLTLGTTNGVILQSGSTNGTSNLVFQATLADLNAALTNLLYQGATNFNGIDRLLITVDDQGNTGVGGPLRATNVVFLTVNPVNDLPIAAITNLTNGQVFLTKDNILIQADVRDPDGQIIRVDFLAGTNLIATLTSAPYAVTFTNPPAATNLALTVRATDDQGGVGLSPGVNITVRVPGLVLLSPPVVSPSRNVQLMLSNSDIGRQFRLEYSTDLKTWTAIGVASNTNGTLEFNHTVPTNETSRFYRAVLLTQ